MRFSNDVVLDLAAVTADARSESIDIRHQFGYSVQVEWTSTTAAADIKIEVSNDEESWVELASPTQAIANNSGSAMFNIIDANYLYYRVFVDFTSGSITTLKATIGGKGV